MAQLSYSIRHLEKSPTILEMALTQVQLMEWNLWIMVFYCQKLMDQQNTGQ